MYVSHSTWAPEAAVPWEPGSRHAPNVSWPPRGLRLDVSFAAPKNVSRAAHGRVRLTMHYELYEGLPLLAKSLSLALDGAGDVVVDRADVEVLALNAPFAAAATGRSGSLPGGPSGRLHFETDQAHSTELAWGLASPPSLSLLSLSAPRSGGLSALSLATARPRH